MYKKQDAQMTRGLAILCMVILHLFCRKGIQVVYSPILWVNEEKPFVYWFGFFSEICVPLYSICVGYARYLLYDKKKASYKDNLSRIFKLLLNYWIILIIFCGLGLIFDKSSQIPGSLSNFFKSVILLHSYNGAWWYLNTYVIMLLVPTSVLLLPVCKMKAKTGIILCNILAIAYYLAGRLNFLSGGSMSSPIFVFLEKELFNFAHVIPFVWLGAYFYKMKVFESCKEFLDKYFKEKTAQFLLGEGIIAIFIITNLLEKSILVTFSAAIVFICFNLLKKPLWVQRVFKLLGKHSTNIWLMHMFFYAVLFKDLVWKVKYPLLILLFMLGICICFLWVINEIYDFLMKKVFKS